MTGQQPPTGPPKPCRVCGRDIPQQAQTCAHCGQAQAPREAGAEGGLRPLGGGPAEPSGRRAPPPPSRAPSSPPPTRYRAPRESAEPSDAQPRRGDVTLWQFVQDQWKTDRWFAVLLGLIALKALFALLQGNLLGVIISGIVLWGLLTYNMIIYALMLLGVGFSTVSGGLMLLSGSLALAQLPAFAVDAFMFGVLLSRHEHYL